MLNDIFADARAEARRAILEDPVVTKALKECSIIPGSRAAGSILDRSTNTVIKSFLELDHEGKTRALRIMFGIRLGRMTDCDLRALAFERIPSGILFPGAGFMAAAEIDRRRDLEQ